MKNITTTTTPSTTLTALEEQVLNDLLDSACGNGYDFGFVEDVSCVPMKVARGVLSSLVQKDIIGIWESQPDHGSGVWTQVTFNHLDRMIEEPTITDLLPR
jgi:hypothetical protein